MRVKNIFLRISCTFFVYFCCRYVRFWDAFDSFVVQAAAVTEGLVCNYSSDGAVLAVGLVDNFNFCCQCSLGLH